MTKVCTHGRSGRLAVAILEESLRRLRTDHLDHWQIHGIVYDNDPELAYAAEGVLEAAVTICGMDSLDVLHQNLRIARGFYPMTDGEMDVLRARCAPTAATSPTRSPSSRAVCG